MNTTSAREALDVLEKSEPLGVRRIGLPRVMYRREEGDNVGGADLVAKAKELGFEWTGQLSYAGMFFRRPRRDGWVDPTRVVRLSMRQEKSNDPIVKNMARYSMTTVFDDGSAVITYSKTPAPLPSTERVAAYGGTGALDEDYARHLEAVRTRAERRRPLAIADADDAMRLAAWVDARLFAVGPLRASNYLQLIGIATFAVQITIARHNRALLFVGMGIFLAGALVNQLRSALMRAPQKRVD